MPSLWEGLGVSALEAAGTGLPLILANVDGLRDVATAATGSYLVTPTPEALSSAILAICNSDRQQTELQALEDSRRVRSSFSPSAGVRSLINSLYQIAV
jgi:glycosyltransferase involved in cell wall biosynthesis